MTVWQFPDVQLTTHFVGALHVMSQFPPEKTENLVTQVHGSNFKSDYTTTQEEDVLSELFLRSYQIEIESHANHGSGNSFFQ